MKFVLGLPRTLFVVVDRFSKMVHFLPCKKITFIVNVAQLFFRYVYSMYGFPSYVMYDLDTTFLRHFWGNLWKMVNTQLNFSSAYHRKIVVQTEVVNQSIGNILWCLVGDQVN